MGGGDVCKVMGGCLLSYRRGEQRLRKVVTTTAGSLNMKLLLCLCIAFSLIAIASWSSSSFMGWTDGSASVDEFYRPRKGYTILMNTWKRHDLLKKSISHYSSCARLDSIHIVWSEPNPPSDSLKEFLNNVLKSKSKSGREVELKFDINNEDSLNNRFKEIKDLKSDAIFSIDDDVIFSCSTVDFAFNVWESAPDAMVGFVPRVHWPAEANDDQKGYYTYSGWWSVWWTGTYSMVLSKAAFFHKKYLGLYSNEMPASLKEFITRNRNCEDIAMSFLVANATNAPPIWVKGKIYEIGSTGISSLGGHTEKRTRCVNRFVAEYGKMPLVYTTLKAVDSRDHWFW